MRKTPGKHGATSAERLTQPEALPGFESVRRHWDASRQYWVAKILPGEYYVTPHDEIIVTVLGSCIAACIRDARTGYGGMNHFMLPVSTVGGPMVRRASDADAATRYGNVAMERLINELLRNGARREDLELKVFGGGQITRGKIDVGRLNIAFVDDYVNAEGLRVLARDVGGGVPRKIMFFPKSGKVMMKNLRSLANSTVLKREEGYLERVARSGKR